MELHVDAASLLGNLTEEQRRRLDALDVAYIELLSSGRAPASTDVEALAHAIVSFYDGLARASVSHETGA